MSIKLIKPFKLERYFAKYEFETENLLCCSDCDGLFARDLLNMADSECLKLWENLNLGYTESKGSLLLREEIAKLYNGISPEDILVCAPEEGIFIAMNCLVQEKDYVICAFPCYQSLYEIAEYLKANVLHWNIIEPKARAWQIEEKARFASCLVSADAERKRVKRENWRFSVDDLYGYLSHLSRDRIGVEISLVINFPHNPTGCLPSKEDFLKIIEIAKENNDYVFSDEMYRFLEFDENDRLPSACELYDRAISLFGMSKTFGMAGVRIGWLVTKDKELMKEFENFKNYTTICNSAPSEILSIIALRNKDTIIGESLKTIKRNLKYLDDFFYEYSEFFSWARPKAGTVCFPKLLTRENSDEFCKQARKDAGILLLPSSQYNYGNRHFRIGFGRKNMPEVLTKFKDYLYKKDFRNFFKK